MSSRRLDISSLLCQDDDVPSYSRNNDPFRVSPPQSPSRAMEHTPVVTQWIPEPSDEDRHNTSELDQPQVQAPPADTLEPFVAVASQEIERIGLVDSGTHSRSPPRPPSTSNPETLEPSEEPPLKRQKWEEESMDIQSLESVVYQPPDRQNKQRTYDEQVLENLQPTHLKRKRKPTVKVLAESGHISTSARHTPSSQLRHSHTPMSDDPTDWLVDQTGASPAPRSDGDGLSDADILGSGAELRRSQSRGVEMDVDEELLSLVDGAPIPPKSRAGTAERGSMPPPAPTQKKAKASASKKTAKSAAKSVTKTKASTAKSRSKKEEAKPSPAPRAKASRTSSVLPETDYDKEDAKEEEDDADEDDKTKVDDKLYCVCKTLYDDERVMIACDRCDEWYHSSCVNILDLEIDLVDQFICPVCITNNPSLSLTTTYKTRCLAGGTCHKPSRGALSKYCSDACGIAHMTRRIESWVNERGGQRGKLWEAAQYGERREGVVVLSSDPTSSLSSLPTSYSLLAGMDTDGTKTGVKRARDRIREKHEAQLRSIAEVRDRLKIGLEVVAWRLSVIRLAIDRVEHSKPDECGWDQRLCFDSDEWQELGQSVVDSYDEGDEGEWWCFGRRKCDRHAGWEKLRKAEAETEQEELEEALRQLTLRERETRKRLEDMEGAHEPPWNANGKHEPLRNGTTNRH